MSFWVRGNEFLGFGNEFHGFGNEFHGFGNEFSHFCGNGFRPKRTKRACMVWLELLRSHCPWSSNDFGFSSRSALTTAFKSSNHHYFHVLLTTASSPCNLLIKWWKRSRIIQQFSRPILNWNLPENVERGLFLSLHLKLVEWQVNYTIIRFGGISFLVDKGCS